MEVTKYLVVSSGDIFDEVKLLADASYVEGYLHREQDLFLYRLNEMPMCVSEYIRSKLPNSIINLYDTIIAFEHMPEFRNIDVSKFEGISFDDDKKLTIFEFEGEVQVKIPNGKILLKEVEVECVLLREIGSVEVEIPDFVFEANEYEEFVLRYIELHYPNIKIFDGNRIILPR